MKHGQAPRDIVEQEFDIITLAGKRAGKAMSPVNPAATLIACKAGEFVMPEQKPGFFQRVGAAFSGLFSARQASKGYFTDYGEGFKYPVADGVADGVDNDGDGADDYNAIFSALSCVGYDLSNACCISDDGPRSVAIKEIVDQFTRDYDAFRAGDDDVDGAVKALDTAVKAGKRHSAKDLAELRAAHAALGNLLDGIEVDDEAEKARLEKEKQAAGTAGANTTENTTVTDAEKAALLAEVNAGVDAKVEAAVKAAVDPLNSKISEQDTALEAATKAAADAKIAADKATSDAEAVKAAAEKSVADAVAAKAKAEADLADAVTKARSRKAAGGHEEGGVDAVSTFKERIKENPNMKTVEAVKVLMANSKVAAPV